MHQVELLEAQKASLLEDLATANAKTVRFFHLLQLSALSGSMLVGPCAGLLLYRLPGVL